MSSLPLRILLAEAEGSSIRLLFYSPCKLEAQVELHFKPEMSTSYVDTSIPGAKYSQGLLSFKKDSISYGAEYVNFLTKPSIKEIMYNVSFTQTQILGEKEGPVMLLSALDKDGYLIYDMKFLPDGYTITSVTISILSDRDLTEVSSTFGLTFINGNSVIIKRGVEERTKHTLRLKGLRRDDVRCVEVIMECRYENSIPVTQRVTESTYRVVSSDGRKYSELFSKPLKWLILPSNCEFFIKQPHTFDKQIVSFTPPSYVLDIKFKREEYRDIFLLF